MTSQRPTFRRNGSGRRTRTTAIGLATGVATIGFALAGTGTAQAATPATVKLSADSLGAQVQYNGGTGNTNNLRIFKEGSKIAVTDVVAINASSGCAKAGATKALCEPSFSGRPVQRVFVQLGDLNDVASVEGAFSGQVFGDAGNDLMFAGQGSGSGQGITYNGGPGSDAASYQRSPVGVSVTRDDQPNDGAVSNAGTSGRDNIRDDVEAVTGSNLADRFTGDEKPNTFNGLGGNDTFTPGGNVDRVNGGAGNDTFTVKDGFVDFVDGGAGTDSAARDSFDSVTGVETLR